MANKGKKKHQVEIVETLSKIVTVMASDIGEAIEKVNKEYRDGKHVLDYDNHIDTSIKTI